MARPRRRMSGSAVKGIYKKAGLLRHPGTPAGLKITMMAGPSRGGYITRYERMRRKVPKQMRAPANVRKIKEVLE